MSDSWTTTSSSPMSQTLLLTELRDLGVRSSTAVEHTDSLATYLKLITNFNLLRSQTKLSYQLFLVCATLS